MAHVVAGLISPDRLPPRRVAIIGGGYAGIAAAVSLAERGIQSTIFEAGKVLGGRARRVEYRDELLDNGQHILSGAYSELLRLMHLVGVGEDAYIRLPLAIYLPPDFSLVAARLPAPAHLAWALLTAQGLTLSDRIAAVRLVWHLRARQFLVGGNVTVAHLMAEFKQPEAVIKFLWSPLTISALNTPPSTASGQVFANVIRDALVANRAASDMLLPRHDLSTMFPEPAANWLAAHGGIVQLGKRVTAITPDDGGIRIQTNTDTSLFSAAVIAVGPHQLNSIDMPAAILSAETFSYEPIATIYLKFDGPLQLSRPMIGQSSGVVQWFFDRRQIFANVASHGGLVAAVISASGPHQQLSGDELANAALHELSRHTGKLPSLTWHRVIIEKFATFACTPDAQAVRPPVTTKLPGIFIAGDYSQGDYPATLEGAARSGVNAANAVFAFVTRSIK